MVGAGLTLGVGVGIAIGVALGIGDSAEIQSKK